MSKKMRNTNNGRPERQNRTAPNGCLRFDRRFARFGIVRLQHSSGTRDQEDFRYRDGILTRLANGGHRETLLAFAAGEITIEDLVRFDKEGNLRFGLRDLRCERAEAAPVAGAAAPATPATGPALPPAPPPAPVVPEDPSHAQLRLPLWSTALDVTIPEMIDLDPDSRRRYATSIRALRQKFATYALSESAYEVLADVSPDRWAALRTARMRGLTVAEQRMLASLPATERRAYLRANDRRVGDVVFEELARLTDTEWSALEGAAEYPPEEELILELEREGPQGRATLRRIGAKLGRAATFADLDMLTEKDWRTISKHWCASPSDWNHMRRSLSAVLSTLFGTHRHPFRHRVIDRVPLKKEVERVPDISREKLAEVVEHLPETIRYFAWFLVLSGVRVGEYLRLQRSHLRPHACAIEVPGTKTEGSRRTVVIEPSAWWVVEEAVPCYLSYGQLRRHWIAACVAAGVEGVTLHDLRHCSGQWAVEGGADEGALQHHFGHATRQMTQRYTRRVEQGRAANALSSHVLPFVAR